MKNLINWNQVAEVNNKSMFVAAKKEEVEKKDLQTTFVIQQILVILCLLVISFIFQKLKISKSYGPKETLIFVSLCFSFFGYSPNNY